MKNFEVDKILITGEAPVLQSDLGIQPNQIPLNKDLGSLAYMNAPQLEDINVDTLKLREMAAEISDDIVDVFIYDTNNDSDGGKWRERTSHTSWYNEELNTATRGGRREFPAVAVIVAEAGKVTIYDGDDPDLSMWMVFNDDPSNFSYIGIAPASRPCSSCYALNGVMCIGSTASSGFGGYLVETKFISDNGLHYGSGTDGSREIISPIADRNINTIQVVKVSDEVIVNSFINDVAMTVLPNAPIDSETGLPVPTIAVATDGGVSVIRDDGNVVGISGGLMKKVSFDSNGYLHLGRKDSNIYYYAAIPSSDVAEGDWRAQSDVLYVGNIVSGADIQIGDNDVVDVVPGVIGLDDDVDISLVRLDINKDSLPESMINFTNSHYNTGWMPGDIKLATLSDTKNETVGVDEATELIGNATYQGSARLTSYTYSNGDATVTMDNDESSDDGYVQLSLNGLIAGKKYKIEMQGNASYTPSAASFNNKIADADGVVIELDPSAQGTTDLNSLEFTASNENYLYLYGGDLTYTLSLKQTGELITNGTFDNGTEGWTLGSGWSVSGGIATHTGTSFAIIEPTTSIGLINGKKYTYTIDKAGPGNVYFYYNGDSNYKELNGEGSFVGTFTAGTYTNIKIGTAGDGATVDNISVRLAEDDRSVNDNGLQIFGQIDKSPVAPGADLVAYSGFSANNYLMQPYNSDLDFGTGDFCIMGWAKISNTSAGIINIMRNGDTQAKSWRLTLGDANGNIVWQRPDSSAMITFSSSAVSGSFAHYCITRRSSTIYFYINGKQITSSTAGNSSDNYTSDNSVLKVYGGGSTSSSQYISLWRISATAPTAEQIAKIYRDEKPLFQDGAQATLYGTSDAVTALAYDDKTELLHVGTASGRSDFNGLRRVNNTTTAVTTAISANNKLIAEQ